jgi:CubicO group peptidase (beta-lactamase class C family)
MRSLTLTVLALAVMFSIGARVDGAAISAYHDQTSAQHQSFFNSLSSDGYHMISLSVYGSPNSPQYAAVWAQEPSSSYVAFHDADTQAVVDFATTWYGNGFRPYIISATGDTSGAARFAGIFVKDSKTTSNVWINMSAQGLEDKNDELRAAGFILTWLDNYGTDNNPLYCGVWEPNTDNIAWNYTTARSASKFQDRFDAYLDQWVVPRMISTGSGTNRYAAAFHDVSYGSMVVRHDMTSAGYQNEVNTWSEDGYYPIAVDGGGAGSSRRFSAVFARRHTPLPRQWNTQGIANAQFSAVDSAIESFMKQNNVRGGQLAVAYNGRLVHSRAFTWAESGYPQTTQTNLFRIASCAKPLTSLGIFQLVEENAIDVTDKAQDSVQMQPIDPILPLNNRYLDMEIWHLLHHQGGWDIDAIGWDPMFNDWDFVNNWELGLSFPISKYEIAQIMASWVQFEPGNGEKYSNLGYSVLGQVIEKERGQLYEAAIQDSIFSRLGLARPRMGHSLRSDAAPGEVRYHAATPGWGTSRIDSSGDEVPGHYGGFNVFNFDAHGGWIMAAADYAKVLAAFDKGSYSVFQHGNPVMKQTTVDEMWQAPPAGGSYNGWWKVANSGVDAFWHNGAIQGTRADIFWTENNVSVAVFFNKDVNSFPLRDTLLTEVNNMTFFPTHDLFPSVGIPKFESMSFAVPTIPDPIPPFNPDLGIATFNLDGSSSRSGDSTRPLTFKWEFLNGPSFRVSVENPTGMRTSVVVNEPGPYTFRLTVGDDQGSSSQVIEIDVPSDDNGVLFLRGDADASAAVDLNDPIVALTEIFLGVLGINCNEAADVDNNGILDFTDQILVLGYLFIGGAPPAAPGPDVCGPDPAGAYLGCERASCPTGGPIRR